MDITYLGHSSFKIKTKSATVVTDPFPDEIGIKFPKVTASIVTVSHTQHSDHNNVEGVSEVKKVISGPGEYEVSDVSILGFPSFHDDSKGKEAGKNTIYVFETEGIRIAHLGDLGHKLSEEEVATLGDIDVLMIPVGGENTLDAKGASEVLRSIEPNITIPMHFKVPGLNKKVFERLAGVEEFVSETGLPVEKEKKLTLKGLLGEEQKIVILERS